MPSLGKGVIKEINALGFRRLEGHYGFHDWPTYPNGLGRHLDYDGARVEKGCIRIYFGINAAGVLYPEGAFVDLWMVAENSVKMEYSSVPDEFLVGDKEAILSAIRNIVMPWLNRMSDYQELISYLSNMYEHGVPDNLRLRADIEPSVVGGYRIERPLPMKGAPGLIKAMGMVHEAFGQKKEAVRCYSEFMRLTYPEKERPRLHPMMKKDIAKWEGLIQDLARSIT